jgi:hypothetical protein
MPSFINASLKLTGIPAFILLSFRYVNSYLLFFAPSRLCEKIFYVHHSFQSPFSSLPTIPEINPKFFGFFPVSIPDEMPGASINAAADQALIRKKYLRDSISIFDFV